MPQHAREQPAELTTSLLLSDNRKDLFWFRSASFKEPSTPAEILVGFDRYIQRPAFLAASAEAGLPSTHLIHIKSWRWPAHRSGAMLLAACLGGGICLGRLQDQQQRRLLHVLHHKLYMHHLAALFYCPRTACREAFRMLQGDSSSGNKQVQSGDVAAGSSQTFQAFGGACQVSTAAVN